MISASYRNFKPYANSRDSSSSRQSRYASRSASSPNNSSNFKNSSGDSFIYKESNKHHWAKLQSKINQRLMVAENISYSEDEEEMARRSIPPPPAAFLAPPAFLETPQDKEERRRTRQERREKTNSKNTETSSPRISLKVFQHTMPFCRSPSSQILRGPSRISFRRPRTS